MTQISLADKAPAESHICTLLLIYLVDPQLQQRWIQPYINPFKPFKAEFSVVIFIHYKPLIAIAIIDL